MNSKCLQKRDLVVLTSLKQTSKEEYSKGLWVTENLIQRKKVNQVTERIFAKSGLQISKATVLYCLFDHPICLNRFWSGGAPVP